MQSAENIKKVLLLLSLIPSALLAQTLGVEDAQNKAQQFLQGQSQTRAAQREVQLKLAYTSKSGDETYYYVFNNAYYGCLYTLDDEGPLRYINSYVLDHRDGIVGFYRIQKPTTLGKYEAFLVSNSSKDEFPIQDPDDDDPTSLQQIITPGTPIDSRIYDLNGRIISTDHKGIVIRDGKVYIIK